MYISIEKNDIFMFHAKDGASGLTPKMSKNVL